MYSPFASNDDQVEQRLEGWIRAQKQVEEFNRDLQLTILHNERTPLEDRFLEDQFLEEPDYPRFSRTPARFGYLRDGRRVLMLGAGRVQTLCGVNEVLEVERRDVFPIKVITGKYCVHCRGSHVQKKAYASVTDSSTMSPVDSKKVKCGHCGGVQVSCSTFKNHVAFHCGTCGWFFEAIQNARGSFMSQREKAEWLMQEEEVEQEWSTDVVPEVQVSDEHSDEEEGEIGFGELDLIDETQNVTEDEQDVELVDDSEQGWEKLVEQFGKLWSDPSWKSLRNLILTETILGRIQPGCVDMLWMVVASLLDSCRGLSRKEEQQFLQELCQLSRHELVSFLGEYGVCTEDACEPIMPLVQLKVTRWKEGCQRKIARFRYPQAGMRILGPKIGVSREVLERVCQAA